MTLVVKKLLEHFMKKNYKKQIQKERNYMSNGKVMIIPLIAGLIKNTLYKMSQYLPKPYETFGADVNVKVDLSNYATKGDLKNAAGIDTSQLASKSDLASLKAEVDEIDVEKLKAVPAYLSKRSNVVNYVAKNCLW